VSNETALPSLKAETTRSRNRKEQASGWKPHL